MEKALDKRAVIASLTKSPHGDLMAYLAEGIAATEMDPDFFAHLITWNHQKGQIRDAKIALPVIMLKVFNPARFSGATSRAIVENCLAHLADLPPFMFIKGMEFAKQLGAHSRLYRRLNERYLRELEASPKDWERVALRDRNVLRTLYSRYHVKPGPHADQVLMKGQAVVGKFADVRNLKAMSASDVAVNIRKLRLPFKVVRALLGERAMEKDVAMAIIQTMTPADLVSHMKSLKKMGCQKEPELRAALEQALEGAAKPKRAPRVTLKTTRAAEALEASGEVVLASKLRGLQERQLDTLGGVEGNWLILGDASASMGHSIEVARQVSGIMGRMIKGNVYLVFFNTQPRPYLVTGKSYEDVKKITETMVANGGTSIGCGLAYALEVGWEVDGIAIVSDGGENNLPTFRSAYGDYVKRYDKKPTVYFYKVPGDPDGLTASLAAAEIDVQTFDLRKGGTHGMVDFYSLPNLVQTMRTQKYSLIDEIMNTPFVTLDAAMPRTANKGMEVVSHALATA